MSRAAARSRSGVSCKSERELALMRRAGRVVALVLAEVREGLRPGVTTAQLERAAARVIAQHGAVSAFKGYPGPYPYPAVTCISVNEELVHGLPGRRVLSEGDLVSVDCGVALGGYFADAAITAGVWGCSPEARRLVAVAEGALSAGIDQMRPGRKTGDVAAAIQHYVERQGCNVVRNYTSHGIGRAMHEEPFIHNHGQAGTGLKLRPGMTVALEPMVLAGQPETVVLPDQWTVASADGGLTAHVEHTVAVTESEPEILTLLDGQALDG